MKEINLDHATFKRYFSNIHFLKNEKKTILSLRFVSVMRIRNKRFTCLNIIRGFRCKLYKQQEFFVQTMLTIYNTVILVRSVIQFLCRTFLFIEKVQSFLDLILSQALARDKI